LAPLRFEDARTDRARRLRRPTNAGLDKVAVDSDLAGGMQQRNLPCFCGVGFDSIHVESNSGGKCRLQVLLHELFFLHDLNSNGILEEEELVELNNMIAMPHYGKDVDKALVRKRYKDLFGNNLNASGAAVPFETFHKYMLGVLAEVDIDTDAQEMIVEQFIREAHAARAMFHCESFVGNSGGRHFLPIPFAEGVVVGGC